jgi:transglutaminase/protease-like cytokinesis protein 3
MRTALFCILCLFFIAHPIDANATNYSSKRIERYVNKTPRKYENNLSSLVSFLVKPLDDDYDKAKAIAFWIASRINYDEYLYNNGGSTKLRYKYKGQTPKELILSRVGICGDFAELFKTMCKRAGVKAYTVSGYAYPSKIRLSTKVKNNSGHAWNYFVYKGKKIYVDTTFMAKGRTGVNRRANNLNHNRALKQIKRENKYKSEINEFDEFYFDFDYKDEEYKRRYKRKER